MRAMRQSFLPIVVWIWLFSLRSLSHFLCRQALFISYSWFYKAYSSCSFPSCFTYTLFSQGISYNYSDSLYLKVPCFCKVLVMLFCDMFYILFLSWKFPSHNDQEKYISIASHRCSCQYSITCWEIKQLNVWQVRSFHHWEHSFLGLQ